MIDLTSCDKITCRSIDYIELCTNLRVLIYRGRLLSYYGRMMKETLTLRCTDDINRVVSKLCENSESKIEKLLVRPQTPGVKNIVDRSWFEYHLVLRKLKSRLAKITPTCCSVCHKPAKVTCDVCDVTYCEDHAPSGLCDHCGVFFCERCCGNFWVYTLRDCNLCAEALPSIRICT